VLDLNLNLLNQPHDVGYKPLRRFPGSAFDISVIVPERTLIGDVERAIRADLSEIPEFLSVEFLREYTWPKLEGEKGQKRSLTYHFRIGATDRTLTPDEVLAIRAKITVAAGTVGQAFQR
jgi:phenylalanyl-tRNA synthetase beta subunit